MERTGVATAEEIGVETLAQRLADELQMNAAVFAYPILLSAWATTGLLQPDPGDRPAGEAGARSIGRRAGHSD
jgi:hypothetical protein